MEDVVLVAAARTPFGKLGGGLSTLTAPELGASVIKEVLSRARVDGGEVDQVQFLLGHVSIQTTERYLGCKQKLRVAVNDRMGIEPEDV